MESSSDNQACSAFASIFGEVLARSLSDARGKQWKVQLAEGGDALPALASAVCYRLDLSQGLRGGCYAFLSPADTALMTGSEVGATETTGEKKDADALLTIMQAAAAALPEACAASQGLITVAVSLVQEPDASAVHALQLRCEDGEGAVVMLSLRFDPQLIHSLQTSASAKTLATIADNLSQANLKLVMDVELNVTLRFGQRQLTLREILELASGSVVELDRQVDEPVELILDGRVIARGEAVIIDGNYGLHVTQVLNPVVY